MVKIHKNLGDLGKDGHTLAHLLLLKKPRVPKATVRGGHKDESSLFLGDSLSG